MKNGKLFLSLLVLSHSSLALDDKTIIVNDSLSPNTSVVFNNKNTINIDAPNENGVSLNFYHKFDVPEQGVILNNKEANANIIINEVTGNKISFIKGNIRIEGKKAHVFIANPNGIECKRCSASRVTDFTLISGTINDSATRFILSDKNYISINGIKKVANQKINIISNEVLMEGTIDKSINTLNIKNGLQGYNIFSNNKFDKNGRISFFEGVKHSLNKLDITHGYGEVYIDKYVYDTLGSLLILNSTQGKNAIYIGG